MSVLALAWGERHDQALGRSFALSTFVHLALAAVLVFGVRWQSHAPDTVTVDLVEALPPPPPAVEAPKPPPKVEPEVKPEPPRVAKPDIAIREKPKPKPKPEAKPKPDPNFEKRLREQVAMEQKALDQQRQERELRDLIARKQAEAARQAASARETALAAWRAKIGAKIRSNIPETALEGIPGNPAAVFDVVQLPTGEVLSVRMRRSSGHPRYDEAVGRAILKSSPLPPPPTRELFQRELELTFRPQDK
jgi:colicin import membrane protein